MLVTLSLMCACGRVVDFEAAGGIPADNSVDVAWKNARLLNLTLGALQPGDVFVIGEGKTFTTMGGVVVQGIADVVLSIDGTLAFSDAVEEWPRTRDPGGVRNEGHVEDAKHPDGKVMQCLKFHGTRNVTFTSKGLGTLDGRGHRWWFLPFIGYLIHVEDRPRLLAMDQCNDTVVENLRFLDSPYWTTLFSRVDGLVIRNAHISARRTSRDGHGLIDVTAFNTDGFDFTGRNIHVHDVTVYNQDDCIAVKDGTENVLVERVNASGMGLTIGSIGNSTVRNVTFRDSYLHNSIKGIYMKFRRGDGGLIEDVTYENIVIDNNEQWPIWIGPAQQSDSRDLCYANPCSLCWPMVPGAECFGAPRSQYRNIVLRNIWIRNPSGSPGVILADPSMPIEGLLFEDVRVTTCQDTYRYRDSFPLLPSHIYDKYVTDAVLIVVASGLLLVSCCLGLFRRGCHTHKRPGGAVAEAHPRQAGAGWAGPGAPPGGASPGQAAPGFGTSESEGGRLPIGRGALLAVVVFVLAGGVVAGWMAHRGDHTGHADQYTRCEGVKNGVATGNTWPVPSCLDDRTLGREADGGCSVSAGVMKSRMAFGLLCVLAIVVLVLKRRNPLWHPQSRSRLGCSRSKEYSPVPTQQQLQQRDEEGPYPPRRGGG